MADIARQFEPVPHQPTVSEAKKEWYLERVSRGTDKDWEEIDADQRRRLIRIAYQLCRSVAKAEEAANEALMRLFQKAKELKPDSDIPAWLTIVTKNVCRENWRKSRREANGFAPADFEKLSVTDFEKDDDQVLRALVLEACLARLDSTDQLIVRRKMARFSAQEIAEEFTLTVTDVNVRFHRAKEKLRGLMLGANGED